MVTRGASVQRSGRGNGSGAAPPAYAAQPGGPLISAIRALGTTAGNAATVRMLTGRHVLARTPAGEYSGKTIAELRALAASDADAVWELRGRYQNMTTEELRVAARSDALARHVAAERRALALTAVPGDPRWPGHQLPHEATAVSRDAQGNVVWRGGAASGTMTEAQRAMPFPQGMNASHTEVKLVDAGQLPRGGTFRITGQFDPCVPCQNAMQAAADRSGCTVEYWWPGAPNGRPFVARPQALAPPGTPPPVLPPTAPPQRTGPAVERAAAAGEAAERTIVLTAPKIAAGALRLAGNVLLTAALWWLSSKLNQLEQERVEAAFAAKVEPEVAKAMAKLHTRAEELSAEDPSLPVYANVTVDVRHGGWTGPSGMSDAFHDVTYVGPVTIGRDKVRSERTIEDHSDCVSGMGYGCAKWGVRRVTYSIEIKFDETADQHFWRVMSAQVVKEIKAGAPARRVAELGDWHPLTARERAEARDPRGPGAHARERDREFKIRWTKLYLAATATRGELARLHDDAQRYLDELEGRARPDTKPSRWPLLDDPVKRKQLEQWLETN